MDIKVDGDQLRFSEKDDVLVVYIELDGLDEIKLIVAGPVDAGQALTLFNVFYQFGHVVGWTLVDKDLLLGAEVTGEEGSIIRKLDQGVLTFGQFYIFDGSQKVVVPQEEPHDGVVDGLRVDILE